MPSADASLLPYVECAAALLELPLAAEHLPGVVSNLAQLRDRARPLLDFPLPPDLDAAPVFEP